MSTASSKPITRCHFDLSEASRQTRFLLRMAFNGRLPVLMRWLAETKPDIACLQELKASEG